jgi:restriction endonuclease S subunit
MKLQEVASVRTGLVLSRKAADLSKETDAKLYNALSLRAITENGMIDSDNIEPYYTAERLKTEYLTHNGDVLFRMSAPYTAVYISDVNENLLIPSHFSVIRSESDKLNPHYLQWWLNRHKTLFYKMASGGTMMGTISSGYIAALEIDLIPLERQRIISDILATSQQEQILLERLVRKKKQLTDSVIEFMINGGNR